jgi:hypothetical protein
LNCTPSKVLKMDRLDVFGGLGAYTRLRNQVRGYDVDKLTRGDYLGLFPELRKMCPASVAGNEIIGACGVGAFQKLVVVWVLRHLKRARWLDRMRPAPYELEELLPKTLADVQLRARKHLAVFGENGF